MQKYPCPRCYRCTKQLDSWQEIIPHMKKDCTVSESVWNKFYIWIKQQNKNKKIQNLDGFVGNEKNNKNNNDDDIKMANNNNNNNNNQEQPQTQPQPQSILAGNNDNNDNNDDDVKMATNKEQPPHAEMVNRKDSGYRSQQPKAKDHGAYTGNYGPGGKNGLKPRRGRGQGRNSRRGRGRQHHTQPPSQLYQIHTRFVK